jgi:hypothetical protein
MTRGDRMVADEKGSGADDGVDSSFFNLIVNALLCRPSD